MQVRLFTIPNLLTLSNLLCGSLGAVAALAYGRLSLAFGLMIAAAGFDFLDGFAARLLRQDGKLGVELDSLADDISFGFLPAAILFALYGRSTRCWLPEEAGFALFVLPAFAALRLAKFNIDESQHTEFCGLPSPAAALFCGSLGLLAEQYGLAFSREVLLVVAWVVGALMVAPVRMFALKFPGYGWKGNEIRYSFLLASVAALAVFRLWAVPAVVAFYVLLSLVRALVRRSCRGAEKR